MQRWFTIFLVFSSGLVVLGAELSASRLLAPFFGTSLPVWSSLIGLILIALAIGNWLGGRISDRHPRHSVLLHLTLAGAVGIGLVPILSRPVLSSFTLEMNQMNVGMLAGSFIVVTLLMGLPMVLLGCITPFAVRVATEEIETAGRIAGRIFAASTMGSFVGCFLPVIFMIPTLGTRWTFMLLSLFLVSVCALGYGLLRQKRMVLASLALVLIGIGLGLAQDKAPIKSGENVVFEKESPYQYVRVVSNSAGWVSLRLNEGLVTHSKYHPDFKWASGVWDFLPAAPFFNPAPYEPATRAKRWAMIGIAAGTGSRLIQYLYGPVHIDGIEIDPVVVEAGKTYFHLEAPNVHISVQDGRSWINQTTNRYDVLLVDAYRQPYIPFELTTREFFLRARGCLNDPGVLAINVARPTGDHRLVNALATTIDSVFDKVFLIHLPEQNKTTLIIGTNQPATLDDFLANTRSLSPSFQFLMAQTKDRVTDDYEPSIILTDDRAPVERLMDLMIFRYIQNHDA